MNLRWLYEFVFSYKMNYFNLIGLMLANRPRNPQRLLLFPVRFSVQKLIPHQKLMPNALGKDCCIDGH